jgi:hypothetical protein
MLGSTSENDETTTPSETPREKAQSRTPDPGDEMTNTSALEDGEKPFTPRKRGI